MVKQLKNTIQFLGPLMVQYHFNLPDVELKQIESFDEVILEM